VNVSKERLVSDSIESIVKDCNQVFLNLWESQRKYKGYTKDQTREVLLEKVKRTLRPLIPKYRKKAAKIIEKVRWPTGCKPLTLKEVYGVVCERCQDTGVAGFLFGIRCPQCNGA
jgi:hypothetical protein